MQAKLSCCLIYIKDCSALHITDNIVVRRLKKPAREFSRRFFQHYDNSEERNVVRNINIKALEYCREIYLHKNFIFQFCTPRLKAALHIPRVRPRQYSRNLRQVRHFSRGLKAGTDTGRKVRFRAIYTNRSELL